MAAAIYKIPLNSSLSPKPLFLQGEIFLIIMGIIIDTEPIILIMGVIS